jgi:DNA-binding MarR family transcriptional regulator
MLYLHRCPDARVLEAPHHLRLRPPTLTEVIQDLIRKRWVTKRRSTQDRRAVRLRLSRQGEAMTRTIDHHARHIEATPNDHDRGLARH